MTTFVQEVIVELYNIEFESALREENARVDAMLEESMTEDPEYWDLYSNSSTVWVEQLRKEAENNAAYAAFNKIAHSAIAKLCTYAELCEIIG